MSELLLVHPVLLQRWDHIFDKRVLGKNNKSKGSHKNWKIWKHQGFGRLGTRVCLLWKHHYQILNSSAIYCTGVSFHMFTLSTLKWSVGPLGSRASLWKHKKHWWMDDVTDFKSTQLPRTVWCHQNVPCWDCWESCWKSWSVSLPVVLQWPQNLSARSFSLSGAK